MEIVLYRAEGSLFSPGYFAIDGAFECYTIEDQVRAFGVKVPGETAIPYGRYRVRRTWSNRFKMWTPAIEGVPMFSAIRIHPGITVRDTEGCVLVGDVLEGDHIKFGTTWPAFKRIDAKIEAAEARGEEVWCSVEHAPITA